MSTTGTPQSRAYGEAFRPVPEHIAESGLCAQADPDIFFPEPSQSRIATKARAVCAACPVRAACAEWAIETKEKHGIWGGLTPSERAAIRSQRGMRAVA